MASKKKIAAEFSPQEDPRAPLDSAALLKAAGPILRNLEEDLLKRADGSAGVTAALKARHAAERKGERTADNYETWRRAFVEQVAAAWFLGVVFVRTLEDKGLIERNRIAGDGALDSQRNFFALAPSLSERDYLLTVFHELASLPAAADLFDAKHNPVWLLAPSAESAQKLLALFRSGSDVHPTFRFGGDPRFLGDLYQDLSENVRKRYALLQTPRFVESYILDKTLEPAIRKFGLNDTTLIDPTCGSGHFLLGAFERVLERRLAVEPGVDVRQAALKALNSVAGTDINPYAISIARFRLTLAFLERGHYRKLKDAPKLPLHLAVADSLLHNPQKGLEQKGKVSSFTQILLGEQRGTDIAAWEGEIFQLEDPEATEDVLGSLGEPKRYAAVVGNPPYITVKDAALRKRYAKIYASCSMNYALTVPFMERFFELGRGCAYVGMITANSFMKREFGKKLVQQYLKNINLTAVINTSGAYIPGHGTPTALLFGTSEQPIKTTVHTVLANRGEPTTPERPEDGVVWQSIAGHADEPSFENDYISVADTARSVLAQHPWALGGGGASELKELLEERSERRLGDIVYDIGFSIILGEDEIYLRRKGELRTEHLEKIPLVIGEEVRDWNTLPSLEILRPFDSETLEPHVSIPLLRELWPWRRLLEGRIVSGTASMKDSNRKWFDVRRLSRDKHRWPLAIAFAFVATHNHFVLDRGGKVFNRSAPIIKLPESATEDDHYALLAYLNSSTALFLMRQVFAPKGMNNASDSNSTPYLVRFEFDGTKLRSLPLPSGYEEALPILASFGRTMDELRRQRQSLLPAIHSPSFLSELTEAVATREAILSRQVALQEEIDWLVYSLFGLTNRKHLSEPGRVALGQRAFELVLPEDTEYFRWHGSHRAKYFAKDREAEDEARAREAQADRSLALLESPECKRRWVQPAGKAAQELQSDVKAIRDTVQLALDNELEKILSPISRVFSSSDARASCSGILQVNEASEWAYGLGIQDYVSHFLQESAVPFLSHHTYEVEGLEKFAAWQHTWELQRREDKGEKVGEVPLPPKYDQKDFRSPSYWSLRGKLDVPKERFISYPGCESDEDGEPVYGWAGWNHRQRAVALATLYADRKNNEGWAKERLQPMLAGMLELMFWLELWHNEPDAEFDGAIPAVQFREFLDAECAEHGFTYDDLRAWRPPERQRAAKTKKKAGPS
jgi:hypothetical protein